MGTKMVKERSAIDKKDKWNIEAMYKTTNDWDKDLSEALELSNQFEGFRGKLTESASSLLSALKAADKIELKLAKLIAYAKMRQDEDTTFSTFQEMFGKSMTAASKAMAAMSFLTPELLSESEDKILKFIEEEPELKLYDFQLRKILREKEHVLSASEENIMAQLSEVISAPDNIYSMLGDADMKFGEIKDENGETVELTHGNYIKFMEGYDRRVRKDAFTNMYEAYKGHINTITASYNANVKGDVVTATLRKYESARQAALFGNNIPEEVYDNLIDAVHEYLPVFHRYVALRKKALKVDELHMYDAYVPLVNIPEKEITFDEGTALMLKALKPLGEDYLDVVRNGLEQGWIDKYENKNKTSGAYSYGSYDSYPYILLNYADRLQDVLTLVHEMGHSMHSYYTRTNQPPVYGDYCIFVAEVASTVNECLLMNHLLKEETDPEMRKFLVNRFVDEFKGTVFRQTMFAEFERNAHKYVEDGGSLTAEWLCGEYDRLNTLYFGESMAHDDFIQYEWARIPHFYSSYYVYQYATGFSAATAISKRILSEGEPAVKDYKKFLSMGSSAFPVDELKVAGVDMSTKKPVLDALEFFKELVEQLEELMEK